MTTPSIGKVVLFKPTPFTGYVTIGLGGATLRGLRAYQNAGGTHIAVPVRPDVNGRKWPLFDLSRPLRDEIILRVAFLWQELEGTDARTAWTDHDGAPAEFAIEPEAAR
jgi:hypothetical protein